MIFVALYSVFIIFICFTHGIRGNITFLFASPTIVHYLSGLAVLWIHGLLVMSLWVVIDLVLLYIVILVIELVLKKIIPSAPQSGLEDSEIGNSGIAAR